MGAPITPIESFHAKIEIIPECGCWIWTAALNSKGYGVLGVGNRKIKSAHKFSYEEFVAVVDDGLVLDHLCRVRCCVNPDHLEPITNKLNLARGINHNREKTHCIKGHELSGENLYIKPSTGTRECKTCRSKAVKRYKINHAVKES